MIRTVLPLTAVSLLLAGCGSTEGYPSLARRPQERITGSAPVVTQTPEPAAAPAVQNPAQQSRLAQLQEQAREAHARFIAGRAKAQQLTANARGADVASEAWSVATVALAELDSRRSEAMVALAELDAMYVRERIDGGDGVSIAAVRDQVTAWVADEDAVLADLRGRVAG